MASKGRGPVDDRRGLVNPEMNRLVEELNLAASRRLEESSTEVQGALGETEAEIDVEKDRVERRLTARELGRMVGPAPFPVPGSMNDRAPGLDAGVDDLVGDLEDDVGAGAGVAAGEDFLGASRAVVPSALASDRREVDSDSGLGRLLAAMARRGASDLLLIPGAQPVIRVDGRLQELADMASSAIGPLAEAEIRQLLSAHLTSEHRIALEEKGAADLTLSLEISRASEGRSARFRYRVNLHRQRGMLAAAIRCLPQVIPTLEQLNLPPAFRDLVSVRQGLVLFCGPTGSGKSSTQAALVRQINETQRCHVLTIEQPVEYDHPCQKSVIEHVEIGVDCPDFSEALRSALRQDPDVILVGEMRDLETIQTAITAAETGHLVLGTLHTHDAVQAIHRMVDVFPADAKNFIRHQLSMSLNAIVSQQLVPRRDGRGRVPAVEVLHATYPVRNHIRSGKLEKLYNELVLGQRHGMITLERSLADLVSKRWIDEEEARVRSRRPEELSSLLRERGFSGNSQ